MTRRVVIGLIALAAIPIAVWARWSVPARSLVGTWVQDEGKEPWIATFYGDGTATLQEERWLYSGERPRLVYDIKHWAITGDVIVLETASVSLGGQSEAHIETRRLKFNQVDSKTLELTEVRFGYASKKDKRTFRRAND